MAGLDDVEDQTLLDMNYRSQTQLPKFTFYVAQAL